MSRAFDGTDDEGRLDCGAQTLTDGGTLLSVSAWVNRAGLAIVETVIGEEDSNTSRWILNSSFTSNGGNDDIQMNCGNGSNWLGYTTGDLSSVNRWEHWCSTIDLSQSTDAAAMQIYFNGSSQSLSFRNTRPATLPTVSNSLRIGGMFGASTDQWDGQIAEVGVWTAHLNAAEVSALAAGVRPIFIRPQSLIFYFPLWGNDDPEPELVNGFSGTITNTGISKGAAHAPVIYPRRRPVWGTIAAGGEPPATQQFVMFPPRLDGLGRGGIFPGNRVQ